MGAMPHSEPLEVLIEHLRRLPGIGLRSAERLAYHILHGPEPEAMQLANAIRDVKKNTMYCSTCGNLTDREPCRVCRDAQRDRTMICVVELPRDVAQIESTGEYNGLYHVLMGRVSALDGIEPEHLRLPALIKRLRDGNEIQELILATSPNVDGDHTSLHVREALRKAGLTDRITVSELARGIPVGTEIEFIDGAILGAALRGRRTLKP